jgi:hypothetical protein
MAYAIDYFNHDPEPKKYEVEFIPHRKAPTQHAPMQALRKHKKQKHDFHAVLHIISDWLVELKPIQI